MYLPKKHRKYSTYIPEHIQKMGQTFFEPVYDRCEQNPSFGISLPIIACFWNLISFLYAVYFYILPP